MAEHPERDQALEKVVEPAPDPIADKSMSGAMLVSTLLLMATLAWALYDEVYGQRPWKPIQRAFVDRMRERLQLVSQDAGKSVDEIKASADYQKLDSDHKAAEAAAAPRKKEIDDQIAVIDAQLAAINNPFQDVRARVAAVRYRLETSHDDGDKQSLREDIAELESNPIEVEDMPSDDGRQVQDRQFKLAELEKLYADLNARKGALTAEQGALLKPAQELMQKRDKYLQERLLTLRPEQVQSLVNKYDDFTYDIKQINIMEANIVDRCESCHVGIREPITLTRANMRGESGEYAGAFTSHPNNELLQKHDPERFGCTSCHGGNGRATTSVEKAHGKYKHWLWPLYYKENVQAGCQQCHTRDVVLGNADVLNKGKELFMERGCVACHRYEGFDRESDGLFRAGQEIKDLQRQREASLRDREIVLSQANTAESNEEAQRLFAKADSMKQSIAQIDGKIQHLEVQSIHLLRDQKKVGPNLKDIKLKLRKEFIPEWLKDPQSFRPGTKMPTFRLDPEERNAIAAFIWQASLDGPAPPQQPAGDGARGKQLFESRGCLACHSIDEAPNRMGGDFAANLSRIGDKNSYDYTVRWIHNPRQRTAPYCFKEKRDLTPEDYARHNLPFVFDDAHSRCPNDGTELLMQNLTVMPNFRLSDQDARDIASYLMSRQTGVSYPAAPFMDDPALFERGKQLARQYGCASCHEIKGLENEQRIGTELTVEGSKPIERLDFGLLTHKAKDGILPDGRPNMRNGHETKWYDAKGFFEQKLTNPAVFDLGKEKTAADRLRMPNIYFKDRSEIDAITTFLLGSVESSIPAYLRYNPSDERRYVQEGWWIIKKYNCMGCHNVQVGQPTTLMDLPMYQGDRQERLPPRLVAEGARVNPDWLLRFLANPALSETDTNRNGVRPYLDVRMPTFNFSPYELQTLVRFFVAASSQPAPYIAEQLEPLSGEERQMAEALFTSPAAPCLKCHMTDASTKDKSAPNFLLARERLKPGWTERWILEPRMIDPTTAMPSGLFARDEVNNRFVFATGIPEKFKTQFDAYKKDHAELLVRYMFQLGQGQSGARPAAGAQPGAAAGTTTGRNVRKGKRPLERASLPRRVGLPSSR